MPLLAAILLAATPPGGAPPTSETDSIVVTGTPRTREEARERAPRAIPTDAPDGA